MKARFALTKTPVAFVCLFVLSACGGTKDASFSTGGELEAEASAATVSAILTPTSGGAIKDSKGNVWAFLGGKLSGDNCDIVYGKNGSMPYGSAAAVDLVVYNGVLHQQSCMYGWYHDTGSGFVQDSAAVAKALDKILGKQPTPAADGILTSASSGVFVDSKGATWKLDANQYILRNGANVSGVPYPNNSWQTSKLVYHQADHLVYILGSDDNWYYYSDSSGLFTQASVSPIGSSPSPSPSPSPTHTATPSPSPSPTPPADVVLTSSTGSFVDSKGATWKLDANQYILRNNANVAGVPYPNNPWQTSELVYHQADHLVYMLGSDDNWYYYSDSSGLFTQAASSPVGSSPTPTPSVSPTATPAASPTPTPTPTSGFTPPGRVVKISGCNGSAGNDTGLVNSAGSSAGSGNTVQFANGQRCVVNNVNLVAGVYYYVPNGQTATLQAAAVGDQIVFANNVTMNGLSICNENLNLENTSNVTIGNSNIGSASCGEGGIDANGTSHLTLINNNISNLKQAIVAYVPTAMNIDGNHFDHCIDDCIGMPYGAGANSFIQRNVFQYTFMAVMEIGFAATNQATTNLQVINNWSNLSQTTNNAINGFGYQLAYSIPLNGAGSTGNVIANNYADGNTPSGPGDICIEISGSGTVSNNQCSNFNYGAIGYNYGSQCTGSEVFTNNNLSGTSWGTIVSYLGCSGSSFQVSGTTTNVLPVPAQPKRISWGGRN